MNYEEQFLIRLLEKESKKPLPSSTIEAIQTIIDHFQTKNQEIEEEWLNFLPKIDVIATQINQTLHTSGLHVYTTHDAKLKSVHICVANKVENQETTLVELSLFHESQILYLTETREELLNDIDQVITYLRDDLSLSAIKETCEQFS